MIQRATWLALFVIGLGLVNRQTHAAPGLPPATILKIRLGDRLANRFRSLLAQDRLKWRVLGPGIKVMLHVDGQTREKSYYYGNDFLRCQFWYFPKSRRLVEHDAQVPVVPARGQWLFDELGSYAPPKDSSHTPLLPPIFKTGLVSF